MAAFSLSDLYFPCFMFLLKLAHSFPAVLNQSRACPATENTIFPFCPHPHIFTIFLSTVEIIWLHSKLELHMHLRQKKKVSDKDSDLTHHMYLPHKRDGDTLVKKPGEVLLF